MTWEEKYRTMPVPESNPCDGCKSATSCKGICPARALWWDRQIRGGRPTYVAGGEEKKTSSKEEKDMTFRYTVTYYPVNQYGLRYSRKPRVGYVRARNLDAAREKAIEKFGPEIVDIR